MSTGEGKHDALRRVRPPATLREIALERLREAIVDGRFEPGSRLVERKLCEQLGISRSVVREVIRHLESEGLVDTVPNRGPVIASIDWNTARQIYEVRALLESAAAAACAQNATAALIATLERTLRDIQAALASGDASATLAATTRFYAAMFACGRRQVAWEMVQRLNGRISRLRAMTLTSAGRQTTGPARLRTIVDAIRAGDAESASAACRLHLAEAADIARRLLAVRERP